MSVKQSCKPLLYTANGEHFDWSFRSSFDLHGAYKSSVRRISVQNGRTYVYVYSLYYLRRAKLSRLVILFLRVYAIWHCQKRFFVLLSSAFFVCFNQSWIGHFLSLLLKPDRLGHIDCLNYLDNKTRYCWYVRLAFRPRLLLNPLFS